MRGIAVAIFMFLISGKSFCQQMPLDPATGKIIYSGVVQMQGYNQKDLYKAARAWVTKAYSSNRILNQFYDDENASILLQLYMINYWDFDTSVTGYIHYTLKIECKDGRYRYTFTDFVHVHPDETNICDGGPLENEKYVCTDYFMSHPLLAANKKDFWQDIKKNTNEHVLAIITDMQKAIALELKQGDKNW